MACCTGVADVQQAVQFGREHDVLVAVRGGGHSAPGYGTNDGGLVIDLSPMKGVRVDPSGRTARGRWRVVAGVGPGEQVFGLATPGGTVSNTGIAGLTLGGGLGWLMGRYGLTVDNLISADVVTADGRVLTVSEDQEPELFWAIRGGGGNFGVVTSFEYRLHPVGEVLGGLVLYPLDQAADVARFYRSFCSALPDEAEAYLGFLTAPDTGTPIVGMALGYNGPISDGEKVLAPARQFGRPLVDLVAPVPYVIRQSLLDVPNAQHGLHRYWRSALTDQLSDELMEAVIDTAAKSTSPMNALIFFYMHGAGSRVPADQTAFMARHVQWDFDAIGQWADTMESARHIEWVRQAWDKMTPGLGSTGYINHHAADDPPEKVRASYGTNLERLRQLKTKYDPTNFFRLNPNITPA